MEIWFPNHETWTILLWVTSPAPRGFALIVFGVVHRHPSAGLLYGNSYVSHNCRCIVCLCVHEFVSLCVCLCVHLCLCVHSCLCMYIVALSCSVHQCACALVKAFVYSAYCILHSLTDIMFHHKVTLLFSFYEILRSPLVLVLHIQFCSMFQQYLHTLIVSTLSSQV